MVTMAPSKSSPLDEVDYSERNAIRATIVALQEEGLYKDADVLREQQSVGYEAENDTQTDDSLSVPTHRRYAPQAIDENSHSGDASTEASGVVALIAAYNEARFIGSVVISALRHAERVIVVDDGSSDGTVAIARKAGADVIEMESNGGKGRAIQYGLDFISRLAGIRAIVLLDGDGQHDALEIPGVVQPVLSGKADLVVGSRFLDVKSDIPGWRQIGQHGLTWFTNVASGTPLTDSQSGFRALSPEAAQQLKFQTSDFSMESEMQFAVHDLGLVAAEVPITCVYEEPSKRNPITHGIEVLLGITRLVAHVRPFFFGTVSACFLWIAGAALSIDVLTVFNQTGQVPFASSMITAGLLMVGGIAFVCGILLQSVRDLMKNYLVQKVGVSL